MKSVSFQILGKQKQPERLPGLDGPHAFVAALIVRKELKTRLSAFVANITLPF
jgi:hypothetical protein